MTPAPFLNSSYSSRQKNINTHLFIMPTITSDVLLLAPLIGHVGNLNMELIGTSRVRHVHQTLSPRAGDVIHPVLWIQGCGFSETSASFPNSNNLYLHRPQLF